MMNFYDRQGRPISVQEWAAKLEDAQYRVLAVTRVQDLTISTIWVGMGFDEIKACIFETAVIEHDGQSRQWERYQTEGDARRGHDRIVMRCRKLREDKP